MAIAEISVIPIGTNTPSLSRYIAGVLNILEKEKVQYQLTSSGTIIEGDVEKILSLVGKMHRAAFSEEVLRVVTTLKIDDRRDKSSSADNMIKSVKEKLSRLSAK